MPSSEYMNETCKEKMENSVKEIENELIISAISRISKIFLLGRIK